MWTDNQILDAIAGKIEAPCQWRLQFWMTMRSFNGNTPCHSDLTNPDKDLQPLRWQACNEVFDLLSQLWDWKTLMEQSNGLKHLRKQ
ncbi:hypothetical protein EON83_07240 [bacterium]|nr:MAG: hypothetical protein EON83_07240 [bacterium]